MFKSFIKLFRKNMSATERKTKTTLAKKLSAKNFPVKREAELKPELFSEIKNQKKTKVTATTKIEVIEEDVSKSQKNARRVKSEKLNNCVVPAKKTGRSTAKSNIDEEGSHVAPLEMLHATTSTEMTEIKEELKESTKVRAKKKKPEPLEILGKVKEEDSKKKWEPKNWQQILQNIRTMRATTAAPVDTMGCHKCADENADEKTQRYHKLVALMLSSQTKDDTTYHAMLRLREHTLTPETISEMKLNVLENILHPVSFYKNKAKYLQQTAKVLIEKYNSDIPNNIKELVTLPGVGPKMAHICMATAWGETTGIGVDVHVHRICNRLQWVPRPTKEPEQTRVALESWLSQDLWKEVNHLLVGFGQTTCTPLKPKCLECLNSDICPAAPKKSQMKVENAEVMNICDKAKLKKTKMHL